METIDFAILALLQRDGRKPCTEIASIVVSLFSEWLRQFGKTGRSSQLTVQAE